MFSQRRLGEGEKKAVYVFWSRQPISQRDLKVRDNYRIRLASFELTVKLYSLVSVPHNTEGLKGHLRASHS